MALADVSIPSIGHWVGVSALASSMMDINHRSYTVGSRRT